MAERDVWVPLAGPRTLEVVRCGAAAFGPEAAEAPSHDGAQQLRLPLGSWMLGLRPLPAAGPGAPPGSDFGVKVRANVEADVGAKVGH